MKYDAITIDTQVVQGNSFHFDGGLLAQLKQFVNGPTQVVISIVVASEILKHLSESTRAAKDSLESAHKRAVELGLKEREALAFSEPEPDVRETAKRRLERFFKEIGAELLSADHLSIRELLNLYFASKPPFASSGKKKNEFPDAIALLSLEVWAKAGEQRILAVSGDPDWAAYSEGSERIDVVSNLSDALAMLQEHADEAANVVQKILTSLQEGESAELKQEFMSRLSDAVSDFSYSIRPEADSAYSLEGDEVELTLVGYELLRDDDGYVSKVVQAGPRKISARVDVELNIHATASFSFSVYDSIDREDVPMGYAEAAIDDIYEGAILITFQGNFEKNEVKISEVEVVEGPDFIEFGYVEPDHSTDYYDDAEQSI